MTENEDLNKAILSIVSEFDQSLRLDATMDEETFNKKLKDYASINKQFLDEKLTEMANAFSSLQHDLNNKINQLTQQRDEAMLMSGNQVSTGQANYFQAIEALIQELRASRGPNPSQVRITLGNQPTYSGKESESIEEWLRITAKNLKLNKIDSNISVELASSYLRDKAERAFLQISQANNSLTWEMFAGELTKILKRRDLVETNLTKFRDLKQKGDLRDYIDEFNTCLLNLKEDLPESFKIEFFRNGLIPAIRAGVMASEPKTLQDAFDKAILLYYSGREQTSQRDSSSFEINQVDRRKAFKEAIKCHYCEKLGHKIRERRKRLRDEQFKRDKKEKPKVSRTATQYNKENRRKGNVSTVEVEELEISSIGVVNLSNEVHVRKIKGDLEVIKGEVLLGKKEIPTPVIFDTGAKRSVISEEMAKDYNIKPSNTKIKAVVADKETFNTFLSEKTRVIFKGHISEIEFIILPRADVLLGIDWFVANGASINPRKRQIFFESSIYTDKKEVMESSDDEVEVRITDLLEDECDFESELDGWNFKEKDCLAFENFELLSDEENKVAQEFLKKNNDIFAVSLEDLKEPCSVANFDIKTTVDTPIRLRPYRVSQKEREIINKEVETMLKAGIIIASQSPWSSPVCLINKPDGSKRFCIDYRQSGNGYAFLRFGNSYRIHRRYLCVSDSVNNHFKALEQTFQRLRKAKLKISYQKGKFFKNKIKVLGHIIANGRVMMDPERVEAIRKWPVPSKVKHIRQFLGLCNSYRKFIKDFAKIARPMTELTRKNVKWHWTEDCQKAFEGLKEKIMSDPILRVPIIGRPFKLYTDASGSQCGAVLTQTDEDGNEYVIAYISRPMKGAELHYGITEKECLAVVWSVKKFRVYLYGNFFILVTDHSALLWLMKIKDANGRLARWAICLQTYEFQIVHRAGKKHVNADALSRAFAVVEELELDHEDQDRSIKELDPWEDEFLLHYLRTGKYLPGSSKKQCKKIERKKDNYILKDENLFYRKNIDDTDWKIVPKINDRFSIIKDAHL
ncbi:unnamed protein product [Brachionus calyciflorus]|uniref:RNA-directed DNA polymerase n=1 Tax=Brachionus calyciflorus TaxID=104777 RepID=A0A814LTH3_9BILA|nr:unnamed protein product [Brachionus calyciflorus]